MIITELRPTPLHPAPQRRTSPGRTAPGRTAPGRASPAPLDVRIRDAVITEVAPRLTPEPGEEVLDAQGRWAIPGLWDAHVHFTQWALAARRLDLAAATNAEHALAILREHLATSSDAVIQGYGHRSATWPLPPSVSALDEVCPDRAVVLISGDAHHAWLNTKALDLLGLPRRTSVVAEREWFQTFPRLNELPGMNQIRHRAVADAAQQAASLGLVGIGEMEFADNQWDWASWLDDGIDQLRVRAAVYPDRLEEIIDAGWTAGAPLHPSGLLTMGPLKIIYDGSLNTRTAWCHAPYGEPATRGVRNHTPDELREMLTRAHSNALQVAVHAIGDAAIAEALDALEATGARGSLEHVQFLDPADAPRMARLAITASVQPAHVLDDATVSEAVWPQHTERCFAVRTLADAGVALALGSDAPVAPLDPWLTLAVAVRRARPASTHTPWHDEQSIPAALALASSTDGRRIAPGEPGDLVLTDHDPLEPSTRTPDTPVALTVCAGRVTHSAL